MPTPIAVLIIACVHAGLVRLTSPPTSGDSNFVIISFYRTRLGRTATHTCGLLSCAGMHAATLPAMDTLLLMGLTPAFTAYASVIESTAEFDMTTFLTVEDVSAKTVGSLLAVFGLTGNRVFLDKASALGVKLGKAMAATPLPHTLIQLHSGITAYNTPTQVSCSRILSQH